MKNRSKLTAANKEQQSSQRGGSPAKTPQQETVRGRSLRRHWLVYCGIMIVPLLSLGIYSRFVEPHWMKLNYITLPGSGQGGSFRAVHLTDFHLSGHVPLTYIQRVCQQAAAQQPDIIFLTGDFVERGTTPTPQFQETLATLASRVPTFACGGNHDGGVWAQRGGGFADTSVIAAMLTAAGIRFLEDEAVVVDINSIPLLVGGMRDLWAGPLDLAQLRSMFAHSNARLKILLAHNPESHAVASVIDYDVMLSGHTHGGQVRLPFYGPLILPVSDRHLAQGLLPLANRFLYISSGVGNLEGIRFNCRPEIAVLTFTP